MKPHTPLEQFPLIDGGPWRWNRPAVREIAWINGVAASVLAAIVTYAHLVLRAHGNPGLLALFLLFTAGLTLLVMLPAWGLALWVQSRLQVCPKCVSSMDRGATRCPHCHYEPEGVRP